jgi:hypothetical protein
MRWMWGMCMILQGGRVRERQEHRPRVVRRLQYSAMPALRSLEISDIYAKVSDICDIQSTQTC